MLACMREMAQKRGSCAAVYINMSPGFADVDNNRRAVTDSQCYAINSGNRDAAAQHPLNAASFCPCACAQQLFLKQLQDVGTVSEINILTAVHAMLGASATGTHLRPQQKLSSGQQSSIPAHTTPPSGLWQLHP
jgi:hypothetical protein